MSILARTPYPIKVAQVLFLLNAVIWLLFGAVSLARITASESVQSMTTLVVAILMLGNVGAMLVAGIGIGRRKRLLFYFGIVVLVVNIILTITDQFGLFDLITLALDLILLGLLLITRELSLIEKGTPAT